MYNYNSIYFRERRQACSQAGVKRLLVWKHILTTFKMCRFGGFLISLYLVGYSIWLTLIFSFLVKQNLQTSFLQDIFLTSESKGVFLSLNESKGIFACV